MIRSTYTLATLEVSISVYNEIEALLRAADYGHVFNHLGFEGMDLTHIALVKSEAHPVARADLVAELCHARSFNAGIHAAARVVCPDPEVEEERSCEEVADAVRALEIQYRPAETQALFARRSELVNLQRKRTTAEDEELAILRGKISKLPSGRTVQEQEQSDWLNGSSALLQGKVQELSDEQLLVMGLKRI